METILRKENHRKFKVHKIAAKVSDGGMKSKVSCIIKYLMMVITLYKVEFAKVFTAENYTLYIH